MPLQISHTPPSLVFFDNTDKFDDPYNINPENYDWEPRKQPARSWAKGMLNKLGHMNRKYQKRADRYRRERLRLLPNHSPANRSRPTTLHCPFMGNPNLTADVLAGSKFWACQRSDDFEVATGRAAASVGTQRSFAL